MSLSVPYATLKLKKFSGIRCVVDLYWVCPPNQGVIQLWGGSMMTSLTRQTLRKVTLQQYPEEWL